MCTVVKPMNMLHEWAALLPQNSKGPVQHMNTSLCHVLMSHQDHEPMLAWILGTPGLSTAACRCLVPISLVARMSCPPPCSRPDSQIPLASPSGSQHTLPAGILTLHHDASPMTKLLALHLFISSSWLLPSSCAVPLQPPSLPPPPP
mmetsp:Transcript_24035/g.52562  ORF Transcript_24035/g.52562 Transcript_24035/m.52562 type:complete len:147 (-) Transcript_24035:1067-1507(-)